MSITLIVWRSFKFHCNMFQSLLKLRKTIIFYLQLKNLANVDLSNIPRLTPGPVMEIACRCDRLESINISLNSVMNDECVAYIARYCRKLKRLYCVSCSISDKGLYWHCKVSLITRKPVLRVSNQVRHKLGCTATGDG